jgi:hypothetical protein
VNFELVDLSDVEPFICNGIGDATGEMVQWKAFGPTFSLAISRCVLKYIYDFRYDPYMGLGKEKFQNALQSTEEKRKEKRREYLRSKFLSVIGSWGIDHSDDVVDELVRAVL